MNRNKLILIIGLAFLVSSCASSLPSSNLAQVKGVLVKKGTNVPIKDVVLRLWEVTGVEDGLEISSRDHPLSEVKTDATGAFLFVDLPPGRYMLDGIWVVDS